MTEPLDLHWKRGLELYEEKKFEAAIAEWHEASVLAPDHSYIRNGIASAFSAVGQQEAAIAEWHEAVRLKPDNAQALCNLASALSAPGYSPEALAAVQAAIQHSPQSAGLYRQLGYHLYHQLKSGRVQGEWQAAEAAFQQAIDLDPTDLYSLQCLAQIQWRRGKKRKGMETLKRAIAANPNDLKLHIQLGKCQARRGNLWGAVQTAYAICNLPKSDEVNEYFAEADRNWPRHRLILLLGMGLTVLVMGGLIWNKRRRG